MAGVELGSAYLSLVPSMRGFAPAVAKSLGATEAVATAAGVKQGKKFGSGFTSGVKGMKTGALVVAASIGGLAASSVNLEKKFSQTMNMIGANTNTPKKGLAELQKLALDLGASTSFSANEAADAMLELSKSGLSPATIQSGALAGTLQLAAAGGTSLESAATIASNALNTFNLKGKDMASISAALAGGANASTASVESLGQALSQVGPGAKNAGLDLNDTVGVLAAFDNAGIKGSDAGTSLKTMLTRLVPQTKAARTAMKDLGLKFTDAHGAFLPITDIAQQLQDKMSGLSQAERTTAMSTIFGSDATRAATVLMEEGSKGVGKYIKATKDKGAAEKAANARMSGTAGALERLSGSWETFRLQLGLKIAPVVQLVSDKLGGLLDWLGRNTPAVMIFVGVLTAFAAGVLALNVALKVGKAIQTAWSVVTGIATGVTKAFQAACIGTRIQLALMATRTAIVTGLTKAWTVATKVAAVAQRVLNAVMKANPIGLIITAVTVLVGVLVWFFTKTKLGKKIIEVAWRGIKTAIKAVADWWTKTAWPNIKKAIDLMKLGFRIAKEKIANAWAGIKSAVKTVATWITERWNTMVTFFKKIPGRIKSAFGNGWNFLKERAAAVVGSYSKGGGGVKGLLWNIVNFIKNTLPNKIKTAAKNIWSGLVGNALDVVGGVMKLVGKIPGVNGTIELNAAGVSRTYKYARGGVLPGYTPGRDVHHFTSPTGGRLALSGGEAIMRPEFTRMVGGAAGVARLNAMARKGQAFKDGGLWTMEKFKTPAGLPGPVSWLVKNTLGRLTVPSLLNSVVSNVLEHFGIGSGGGGGGAVKAGSGGRAGMGVSAMTKTLHSLIPGAYVTSGYRPGARTVTGYPSYHGLGRAIDIVPGSSGLSFGQIWDRLMAKFGKVAPEIFYSGRNFSRFGKLGNKRQDHWDHVHWAMANGGVLPKLYDQGGWLPRGLSVVENRTSKPERILNEDQWNSVANSGQTINATFNGITDSKVIMQELRREQRRSAIRLGMVGR